MSRIYRTIESKSIFNPSAQAKIEVRRVGFEGVCAGRRKAIEAFKASPGGQHVVTTTTLADYLGLLSDNMALDWALEQARPAVTFVAVCRLHDDGASFTRRLIPCFPKNVRALANDLLISDKRASIVFERLQQWDNRRCGNVPTDFVVMP